VRRAHAELALEVAQDLERALAEVGVRADCVSTVGGTGNGQADFILDLSGFTIAVQVKAIVTPSVADSLVTSSRRLQLPLLVASERIEDSARALFREEGVNFFDARGWLRVVSPGVIVDTAVPGRIHPSVRIAPLSSETAKEVALVLLEGPGARPGVRELARVLNRAPSSVSLALEGLRAAGLVTTANEPLVPDLFWEVAATWCYEQVPLADLPSPGEARRTDQLQLGLGHGGGDDWVLDEVGWALTDTLAASAWGAPVVASGDYPPDFYVPTRAVLARSIAVLGRAARSSERACSIAVAPTRTVCRRRVNLPNETWPVASHVVVALDLARDRARGRDVLERWRPEGVTRVW
jgi:hypothetical protein